MPQSLAPMLFAVLSVIAQDTSVAPAADVVSLTFAWPTVTRARVDAEGFRERYLNGKYDTTVVHVSYRMTGERDGDEYVVRFDDFRLRDTSRVPGSGGATASLPERVAAIVPGYRVNTAGEFVRLEGTAALRAFVDSLYADLATKDAHAVSQLMHLKSTLMSDPVLSASAEEDWNALVSAWAGAKVEVGRVYAMEAEEPVPLLQGKSIRFRYEFSALRRRSCDSVAAPNARDCVELQRVSVLDSAASRQFFENFVTSFFPDSAKRMGLPRLNVKTVTTVVARPETMLPVLLVVTKEVSGSTIQEEKEDKVHQLDIKVQRFRYCVPATDPCAAF